MRRPEYFIATLIAFVFIVSCQLAFAQSSTLLRQSVRGIVYDQDTKSPIIGATIIIEGTSPVLGSAADIYGYFKIEHVPVGRISLKVSAIGYEESVIPNIVLTSAKEAFLEVGLVESFMEIDEVVVTAKEHKGASNNEMVLISARPVTVEETKRYAGSLDDPARMISAYAGVTSSPSGDNDIVVRGNSPKGIQWRLEGIEIPNPNHFADEGSTGGPINALSSNMLANSEFYSGAFAPMYGNAFSGVFDVKLRKGNNQKREYAVSLGVLGADVAIEGPFKEGGKSSYLANYRYSSLSLLDEMGLVDFGGVPKYQDLSFNINLPTNNAGQFSVFGLGGLSTISQEYADTTISDQILYKSEFKSSMGIIGVNHNYWFTPDTYLLTSLSMALNGSGYEAYQKDLETGKFFEETMSQTIKTAGKLNMVLSHKFNSRHLFQTGIVYTDNQYAFDVKGYDKEIGGLKTYLNDDGGAGLFQSFVSWKYRIREDLTMVSGLHFMQFGLNDNYSIEPRASIEWKPSARHLFSAGFGTHSKMEAITNYFGLDVQADGSYIYPNKDMGFSKARHYVLGYDYRINANMRFKTEVYYQELYEIPVENDPNSSHSLINSDIGFTTSQLVNKGAGENYGLELTLERFFSKGYYYLVTASIFDSKYKAMDGVWRNTRYNTQYAGNILAGKEFQLKSKKGKDKVLSINLKGTLLGGRWYTPIDIEASKVARESKYVEGQAFSKKWDDVLIVNLAATYRANRPKTTHEIKLDIQNFMNNTTIVDQYYNPVTEKVEYFEQLPLLPVMSYKVIF